MCDACKHANVADWWCPSWIAKNDWLFESCSAGKRMLETTCREALSEQTAWIRSLPRHHILKHLAAEAKGTLGVFVWMQPIASLLSMRNLWSQSSDAKDKGDVCTAWRILTTDSFVFHFIKTNRCYFLFLYKRNDPIKTVLETL